MTLESTTITTVGVAGAGATGEEIANSESNMEALIKDLRDRIAALQQQLGLHVRQLEAMTKHCEALAKQNEIIMAERMGKTKTSNKRQRTATSEE